MASSRAPRPPADRRLPRGAQRLARSQRAGLDPEQQRQMLLGAETGTIIREGRFRIALAYPCPYRVAMSSLGYQVIYRLFNSRPDIVCERVLLADDLDAARAERRVPRSLESGRPLDRFDLIAVSATYDLDIGGIFDLLDLAGIPALREKRGPRHPPILLGGPLTASNALPLGPFIDLAVIGDGEAACAALLDVLADAPDRDLLLDRMRDVPGVWIPEIHGDAVPATQKVSTGWLPAVGQITTPHTELSNLFLIEPSRGCPRFCKFCLVRAPESPMRELELAEVLAAIPAHAARVGFVGAAVSEWEHIREALRSVVASGRGIGISSLRADRLDADYVDLLHRGGYRTMTIASDAPSQRQRDKMAKGLRTHHLLNAARLAKAAGMLRLKVYVIIGLPDESDADIDELIAFSRELAGILPTALGVSPLVPKLHTPLGDAEFAGIAANDRVIRRLQRELGPVLELRPGSARWSWVEYRMSQGGQDAGLAAWAAWQAGGSFAAWRSALASAEERGGLVAARTHARFAAAGMR